MTQTAAGETMQRIEIDIVPTAQARARHSYVQGLKRVVTHKSGSQRDNERTLEAMLMPYKPHMAFAGAVGVSVRCFMPIPLSVSAKRRKELQGAFVTKKPDADNLLKQVIDCMTRLCWWQDDKQVAVMACEKRYSDRPHWEIEVRELGDAG